jgi:membrane protein implicated in regulation of membrane protease activity
MPLAFLAATAIAASVFIAGWDLLAVCGLKPEHRIDSKTLFDLVKLSFGVVAGAGALVALVVAYRRQRVDEDGAMREATRLHTERFTTAVSQLGDDSAAVRLGGQVGWQVRRVVSCACFIPGRLLFAAACFRCRRCAPGRTRSAAVRRKHADATPVFE